MGTDLAIDVVDLNDADFELIVSMIERRMDAIEDRFSPYRPGSELTLYGSGRIAFDDLSGEMRKILDLSDQLRAMTGGYFDVVVAGQRGPARQFQKEGSALDPSGVVKGWAIQQGAEMLSYAGSANFCIEIGGDMWCAGHQEDGRPWQVGLRRPDIPGELMAVVEVSNAAVATSGTYERGEHIVRLGPASERSSLCSLSVIGPEMVLTDAFATAAFSMGRPGLEWLANQRDYQVFGVDVDGMAHYSESLSYATKARP